MRLRLIAIFLALTLVAIGAIGFLGLNSSHSNGQYGCLISVISGNGCPPTDDAFFSAIHHVAGLQYITQSIVSFGLVLLLILILLPAFLFFIFPRNFYSQEYFEIQETYPRLDKKFLRWLSLRNKRDSHGMYYAQSVFS